MPRYYVSKHLPAEMSLIYVEDEGSWTTVRFDGAKTEHAGTIPTEVVEQLREVDSAEAGSLIEQRRVRLSYSRTPSDRRYEPESDKIFRNKVLTVVGVLAFCVVVGFAVSQSDSCVSAIEIPRLHVGMTYEEVTGLLGGPGALMPSDAVPEHELLVRVWDIGGDIVRVTFRDGLVESILIVDPRM